MLWRIRHLEIDRVQGTYSGPKDMIEFVADGVVIFHAVPMTESAELFGIIECNVTPRVAGEFLVWFPSLERMVDHLLIPAYVSERGIPVFDTSATATLRRLIPALSKIPPLRSRELMWATQWTAPANLLGTFPDAVRARTEGVLAVSHGDLKERLRELTCFIERAIAANAPVTLRELSASDERIEFYLDAPGHPTWSPLAMVDGEVQLHFNGFVAVMTESATA